MALFTTRQKQQMLVAAIPVVIALAALGAAIKYWYISVPVIAGIIVAICLLVIYLRKRQIRMQQERAQLLQQAGQTLHEAQLTLASSLIKQYGPDPATLVEHMHVTLSEARALLAETQKVAPSSPAEARPPGAN